MSKPAELINFSLVVTAIFLLGIHVATYKFVSNVKGIHSDIGRKKRRNSLMIAQEDAQPLMHPSRFAQLGILNSAEMFEEPDD